MIMTFDHDIICHCHLSLLYFLTPPIAQLVEQVPFKDKVLRSTRSGGTKYGTLKIRERG